jgi:hypothetical protein
VYRFKTAIDLKHFFYSLLIFFFFLVKCNTGWRNPANQAKIFQRKITLPELGFWQPKNIIRQWTFEDV